MLAAAMRDEYGGRTGYPSRQECYDFLIETISVLTSDELLEVGRFVCRADRECCGDVSGGLAVNLDQLSQLSLETLYDMFVVYKQRAGSAEDLTFE